MPYTITKTFNICYGHRVHNQFLRNELAGKDNKCACRHLHGHPADIQVTLTAAELRGGVVLDFKELGFLKEWLDEYLDHRFVIDRNDPLMDMLYGVQWQQWTEPVPFGLCRFEHGEPDLEDFEAVRLVTPDALLHGADAVTSAMSELYSGTIVVGFVPTSENLSRWIAEMLRLSLRPVPGVKVKQVTWYETPKSQSTFSF